MINQSLELPGNISLLPPFVVQDEAVSSQMFVLHVHKCLCCMFTNVCVACSQMFVLHVHKCLCCMFTNVCVACSQMFVLHVHKCLCCMFTNVSVVVLERLSSSSSRRF